MSVCEPELGGEDERWMCGFPPPLDQRIRFGDGSFMRWPQSRWTYNHITELVPTKAVWRGSDAAIELPTAPLPFGDVVVETAGGSLPWHEALASTYTDGLLVLHQGEVVFEEYFGECEPHLAHLTMSCNNS